MLNVAVIVLSISDGSRGHDTGDQYFNIPNSTCYIRL